MMGTYIFLYIHNLNLSTKPRAPYISGWREDVLRARSLEELSHYLELDIYYLTYFSILEKKVKLNFDFLFL